MMPMSQKAQSMKVRSNHHATGSLLMNAAAGIEATNDFGVGTKANAIMLETQQAEDCGMHHVSKATQLKLS